MELSATLGTHIKEHISGYNTGYQKGFYDGKDAIIKELRLKIIELEKQLGFEEIKNGGSDEL